jgi:polar amino acid transport system ATP-binding protein
MKNDQFLEVIDVSKSFGDFPALKNISFEASPGSVTTLVGPSGSGKSTLLRSINMLESIDSGGIFFQGEMIGQRIHKGKRIPVSAKVARRQVQNFGMVFQSFNLFPNLTALENVSLAPERVLGRSRKEARESSMELLNHVGLGDKMNNYPSELSGGQQQRVAIARALAIEPKILLFDEPTSALDPELVGEVLMVMKSLANEGSTMIIVTHEMSFARDISDQMMMLDGGEVVERGTPDEIIQNPKTDRARKFFSSIMNK